jgi:Na+/proline symporter
VAANAGKFRVFDFSLDFWKTYTFWSGVIGGAFMTTASHGTDQLIVQRLLAARSERQSKIALISSGFFVLFQFTLFLFIGAMLWVFYRHFGNPISVTRSDRIFPTFIVTEMPHGISGLLIAAILAAAMSNLSAALNSLSSSSIVDFYLRRKPEASEQQRIVVSRAATIFWGLVLFALAIVSRHGGRVVEVGLSIASVAYGALLGVFMLGVLTRRATESGAMAGMFVGFVLNVCMWQFTKIPFTWWVLIGSVATFVVGYISSFILDSRRQESGTTHG